MTPEQNLVLSFFSDFTVGLILLILGTFFIPPYLNWRDRAKLRFQDSLTRKGYSSFSLSQDGKYETTLNWVVQNIGNKKVSDFYWEIHVPKSLNIELQEKISCAKISTKNKESREEHDRHYGYVEMPLYSFESIDFPYELKIKTDKNETLNIEYYFKTESGRYPFFARTWSSKGKYWFLKKYKVKPYIKVCP